MRSSILLEPVGDDVRVGLIVAGVQKAGTSTLFAHLSRHPHMAPSSTKEAHFFDDETVNWNSPDYGKYHSLWISMPTTKLRFEATPIYIYWPSSMERISRYNPDMRMVIVLRDPAERALSHWQMQRARGIESLSFSEAIRAEPERLSSSPPLSPPWRHYSYVNRGFYAGQIRRLQKLFSPSNYMILSFTDVITNWQGTLDRITEWLDIKPIETMEDIHLKKGAGLQMSSDDAKYLRNVYYEDVMEVGSLTGIDVSSWPTAN